MKSRVGVPAVVVFVVLALAALAFPRVTFAEPMSRGFSPFALMNRPAAGPFLSKEIGLIQSELSEKKIGDIEAATLFSVRDRLSIAEQKDTYVLKMGMHSFLLPGLGQLEMGNTGEGAGFLAADLAVVAGSFVVAYYLLPTDLRFDRIDYFTSNFSTINSAWCGHSFTDYLPAAGAFFGGMVIDQTLRHWSSARARREAVHFIDEGRATFTPRVGIGFIGFDVAW
jgi:hypothetical protein